MPETNEEKVTPDHFVSVKAERAYSRSAFYGRE
jgi:hypothetical protein